MITTAAEKMLLERLQMLRVVDYQRYSELLEACTGFINSEINRLSHEKKQPEKIIVFPGSMQKQNKI